MIEICWASDFFQTGNAFGYSIHNRMMREHSGKYLKFNFDAPHAISIASADTFKPVRGKFNFLFSMFETEHLPPSYIRNISNADHIIVPCDHNERVFRKYTDLPIDVCQEGCDSETFSYVKRSEPKDKPFRFLWVGAPNPRKGYLSVVEAWKGFEGIDEVELYIKTTSPQGLMKDNAIGEILEMARKTPVKFSNIIFDARKVEIEELVKLYHDAHAFLLPTTGEGWGLTLCEAMATGLPCIATKYSGTEMYFDKEVGYPIRYEMKPYAVKQYSLATEIAIPDTNHLFDLMAEVKDNYRKALDRGKRASRRIREHFTWDRSARILHDILKEGMKCH